MNVPSTTASSGVVARVSTNQLNNSTKSITFFVQQGDGFAFPSSTTYVVAWRCNLYANAQDDPLARIGVMSGRTSRSLTVAWGALNTGISPLTGTVLVAQLFLPPSDDSIEPADELITARRDAYNVRDYGVVGDGITDDTAAIQKAINALPTSGGAIYFPHGVYIISAKLTIQNHATSLIGEAWSSVFADQADNQPGMTGASVIKASPTSFPSATTMIQAGLLGTNEIWTGGGIYNMVITGTKGTITPGNGIDVLNMQAFRVIDCNINAVAVGVHVKSDEPGGMSNDLIEHCILNNLSSYAIWMDGGSDQNYVRFNYIQAYTGYGIRLSGIGNYAFGNHIESGLTAGTGTADGAAIFSDGTYSFVQNNDTSVGTITYGIYIGGSHSQITDNDLTNVNSTAVSNGSGIWVNGAITDVLVAGNLINDNNSHMVYGIRDTSSTAGGVTIGVNAITGYTTAAINTAGNLAPVYLASKFGATDAVSTTWTPLVRMESAVSQGDGGVTEALRVTNTNGSATGRAALGFYEASTANYTMARLSSAAGSAFAAPVFHVETADSSKALHDRITIDQNGNVTVTGGNLILGTAGNKLSIATGSNASAGTGTLSAGTVTVSTTAVTASSLIFLTDNNTGSLTNVGTLNVSSKTAGTGFTVNSSNVLDTSNFSWLIIN